MKQGLSLFIFAILFLTVFTSSSNAQSPTCLGFPSGAAPLSGYAPSWDVFDSNKVLLVKTDCPASDTTLSLTVGKGSSAQLVHNISYAYRPEMTVKWQSTTLAGTPFGQSSGWLTGIGTASLAAPASASASNPFYFVGYVCTSRSGVWKCGCVDTTCAVGKWQLQTYIGDSWSGTTGGSTSGGATPPKDFPAISSCGTAISVSPSSLDSNLGDGCRTLTLSAGTYGMLRINGHSGGVLTLKCASAGDCKFSGGGTGSPNITNSDGILLDGLAWTSGYLTLEDSKNIRVQNSSFRNLVSTGLAVNLGDPEKQVNIQLVNNDVYSDPSRVENAMGDGTYNYTMDYGFRIYNAKSIYIANNTFSGGFNHAISLKEGIGYALIENNTFNSCGRNCVEVGQEPISSTNTNDCKNITSEEAMITKNTFKGSSLIGVLVKNIRKTTVKDNSFLGSFTKVRAYTFDAGDQIGSCVVSGTGIPSGRQIIDSGN